MKHSYTLARRISAGHSLVGHPRCKSDHGHEWLVQVSVTGEPNPACWMIPGDAAVISEKTHALLDELDGRNLNTMIPAGTASTHGLALYLWERLAMHIHGLSAIEVSIEGERSVVEL